VARPRPRVWLAPLVAAGLAIAAVVGWRVVAARARHAAATAPMVAPTAAAVPHAATAVPNTAAVVPHAAAVVPASTPTPTMDPPKLDIEPAPTTAPPSPRPPTTDRATHLRPTKHARPSHPPLPHAVEPARVDLDAPLPPK
jgi:hypothetical protein